MVLYTSLLWFWFSPIIRSCAPLCNHITSFCPEAAFVIYFFRSEVIHLSSKLCQGLNSCFGRSVCVNWVGQSYHELLISGPTGSVRRLCVCTVCVNSGGTGGGFTVVNRPKHPVINRRRRSSALRHLCFKVICLFVMKPLYCLPGSWKVVC